MTKPMSAETAAKEIRYELNKLPGRIITGIGAREELRALTGLSPSQFAKGLAYNLAVYNDIFIVINERRGGSTYLLTTDIDIDETWRPIADDSHYMQARLESLSKMMAVREEALMAQDAPLADRSIAYSWRRAIDQASAILTPVVSQAAYRAHIPEKKIKRWMKTTGA